MHDWNVQAVKLRSTRIKGERPVIVILSGSGLSAESGIATYRGPENNWRRTQAIHAQDLKENPLEVFQSFNDRIRAYGDAKPNAAHFAIAAFRTKWKADADIIHITQNIDTLCEQAADIGVHHLHGSLMTSRCSSCGAVFPRLGFYAEGRKCPVCKKGAWSVRPDVVLFGEMPYGLDWILPYLACADVFLAVGTSGTVCPAADFVRRVKNRGCMHRILITKELPFKEEFQYGQSLVMKYNHVRLGEAGRLLPSVLEGLDEWLSRIKMEREENRGRLRADAPSGNDAIDKPDLGKEMAPIFSEFDSVFKALKNR